VLAVVLALILYNAFNTVIPPLPSELPLPAEVEVNEILKTVLPPEVLKSKSSTSTGFTPARSPFSRMDYDPLELFEDL
jgi:hypothetical protein